MGFAYAEMIAPTILYAYPGITREEYAEKLAESYQHTGYPSLFNAGVRSLADVLGIKTTAAYREARQFSKDQHGLPLEPPRLETGVLGNQLIVKVHTHNVVGRKRFLRFKQYMWGFEEGQYFDHDKPPFNMAFVHRIIEQQPLDSLYYNSKIQIIPFKPIATNAEFLTERELAETWPQFGVDAMYNFAQSQGGFYGFLGSEKFKWICENGKYYLHPQTLDSIPASLSASLAHAPGNGYTDMVLTAEAFKRQEWEVLDYKLTWDQLNDFYHRFPEVLEIMKRAIWDAHTSQAAKLRGLSTRDFLSARAVGFRY